MSELALVLKTPVEELIPAMLAWNNKELMEAVTCTLSHYEGITYWCFIEILHESGGSVEEKRLAGIAYEIHADYDMVKDIVSN